MWYSKIYSKENTSKPTFKFLVFLSQIKVPFELQEIDISKKGNEKYFELYKYDIPVIFVNNVEVCRHKINETTLRKALQENKQEKLEE